MKGYKFDIRHGREYMSSTSDFASWYSVWMTSLSVPKTEVHICFHKLSIYLLGFPIMQLFADACYTLQSFWLCTRH